MITGTYAAGGILLIATAILFGANVLTPWTQTIAWRAMFFFSSAAHMVVHSFQGRHEGQIEPAPADDLQIGDNRRT